MSSAWDPRSGVTDRAIDFTYQTDEVQREDGLTQIDAGTPALGAALGAAAPSLAAATTVTAQVTDCTDFIDVTLDIKVVVGGLLMSAVTVGVNGAADIPPGGWLALLEPPGAEYGTESSLVTSDGEIVLFQAASWEGDHRQTGVITASVPAEACCDAFGRVELEVAAIRAQRPAE
jgi:hypothetical protein